MNVTPELKLAVWLKGQPVRIDGQISARWRKDACNAWMDWNAYGDRNLLYGWEIDHVNPQGGDNIANLQPLHWENNAAKGEGRLVCAVTSSGTKNVPAIQVPKHN